MGFDDQDDLLRALAHESARTFADQFPGYTKAPYSFLTQAWVADWQELARLSKGITVLDDSQGSKAKYLKFVATEIQRLAERWRRQLDLVFPLDGKQARISDSILELRIRQDDGKHRWTPVANVKNYQVKWDRGNWVYDTETHTMLYPLEDEDNALSPLPNGKR